MLIPILLGVAAVALAVAATVLFLRARAREDGSASPAAVAADNLGEMRAIGQRIETLVSQQQLQGETARQHLAQKLDAVGEGIDQQRTHLSGLQNELRHEVHRRDAEMDEIRTQLASIQQATALGSASVPPQLPSPEQDHVSGFLTATESPFGAPEPESPFDDASFVDEVPMEGAPMETGVPEAPHAPALPELYAGDGLAASFDETPFADGWDTGEAPASSASAPSEAGPFSDPFAFVDPFAAPSEADPARTAPSEAMPADAPTPDAETFAPQPAAEMPPAADDGFDSLFEDVSFGSAFEPAFESLTPLPAPAAPAPPSAAPAPVQQSIAPPSDSAWVARSTQVTENAPPLSQSTPAVLVTPPPAAQPAPVFTPPPFATAVPPVATPVAPAVEPVNTLPPAPASAVPAAPVVTAPEGADDLTVISTIDETIQSALYENGVITLDEIARWGRADARRIASIVSVSDDTIMNQWIFEAQAALFQSFSTRK